MSQVMFDIGIQLNPPANAFYTEGNVTYYPELEQGSDEWRAVRCGLLTASEMKHVITPKTLQPVKGVKEGSCAHLHELAAQRVTGHVEPSYISDDMLRGKGDEIEAIILYDRTYGMLDRMGFITNSKWGFTLGYSPDALIGIDGTVEVKSRCQKYQFETILADEVPAEYVIQLQTGLLVSERDYCDFISYCGGMPMFTKRVEAAPKVQAAIIEAATIFHQKLDEIVTAYNGRLQAPGARFIQTERKAEEEITI
jgi:hypothetical protein